MFYKHKNIAELVADLDRDRDTLFTHIARISTRLLGLETELRSIHTCYRTQLCSDCCHKSTCGITQGIKYGDECDSKSPVLNNPIAERMKADGLIKE